jgi:DNA-binding transcriptional LysR family regulator
MDSIINIATFVKVVEAGGFAAASRKLGMSPSTVTAHIQDLEQRLGARLLNRSTRKISLTEVGNAYYESCLQILADVDEANNVVHCKRPRAGHSASTSRLEFRNCWHR